MQVKLPYWMKLVFKQGFGYLLTLIVYGPIILTLNKLTFASTPRRYTRFNKKKLERYLVTDVNNESGIIMGPISYYLDKIKGKNKKKLLLAGEDKVAAKVYSRLFDFKKVDCTGIAKNTDWYWNFEYDHPEAMDRYDVVVFQAILEHLIDPYCHVRNISNLLNKGGTLIVHSLMPGFGYHRYPIDCFRFYPDWFENVAKKLDLRIIDRYNKNSHLVYLMKKTTG